MDTKFASPERSSPQDINRARHAVISSDVFRFALNHFPEVVLVLDKNRQAVYANQELLRVFGFSSMDAALGKRPGEIFKCVHFSEEEGGCGTTEFCRDCGAVKAILMAQSGKADSQECRLTIRTPQGMAASLDLRVWAIPATVQEEVFTFFVIRDIRDEKRRASLEQTFFHDLLNDTNILKGFAESLKDGLTMPGKGAIDGIFRATERIVNTVLDQRDLLVAENGEYEVVLDSISVSGLLDELVLFYENSYLIKGKEIILKRPDNKPVIKSDYTLLWRVLSNLIKNALEAVPVQGSITVGYKEEAGKNIFFVNNPGVLSDSVRHQVFQRSFTTKGAGRGLGTYSARLFTEQYLKGKIWFKSDPEKGTTFFVSL